MNQSYIATSENRSKSPWATTRRQILAASAVLPIMGLPQAHARNTDHGIETLFEQWETAHHAHDEISVALSVAKNKYANDIYHPNDSVIDTCESVKFWIEDENFERLMALKKELGHGPEADPLIIAYQRVEKEGKKVQTWQEGKDYVDTELRRHENSEANGRKRHRIEELTIAEAEATANVISLLIAASKLSSDSIRGIALKREMNIQWDDYDLRVSIDEDIQRLGGITA